MVVIDFYKTDEHGDIREQNTLLVSNKEEGLRIIQKLACSEKEIYYVQIHEASNYKCYDEAVSDNGTNVVTWKEESCSIITIDPYN